MTLNIRSRSVFPSWTSPDQFARTLSSTLAWGARGPWVRIPPAAPCHPRTSGFDGGRTPASQCVGREAGERADPSWTSAWSLMPAGDGVCLRPPSLQLLASTQSSGLIIRYSGLRDGRKELTSILSQTPGPTCGPDWGANPCLRATPIGNVLSQLGVAWRRVPWPRM